VICQDRTIGICAVGVALGRADSVFLAARFFSRKTKQCKMPPKPSILNKNIGQWQKVNTFSPFFHEFDLP
jgi:hypothetical protein